MYRLLPLLTLLIAPSLWADEVSSAPGGPATLSPGAWEARWPLEGEPLVRMGTSPAGATLETYKLQIPQYSQKARLPAPGEPGDHVTVGPMELVTGWDADFLPFQTLVVPDSGRAIDAWRLVQDLGEISIAGGRVAGLARPAEVKEGDRLAVLIAGRFLPVAGFDADGLRLADAGATASGSAQLVRAIVQEGGDRPGRVYHKVASDATSVTYVWPDPRDVFGGVYEERTLRVSGDYQLTLDVRVHNLGSRDLPHRMVVTIPGFQNPNAEQPGMLNPVVDQLQAICSVQGSVTREMLSKLAEEPVEPLGNVDFAGVESRYFVSALAPLNLAQSRCLLRGAPYGVLEAVVESLTTAVAVARTERCSPDWATWVPAAERCGALAKRLGAAGLGDADVKRLYAERSGNLDPTTSKAWASLLAAQREVVGYQYLLYVGPKDVTRLTALGHNLVGSLDFWVVGFLAKPMLYLLRFFYDWVPHWGVAIILLTILVKALTWYWSQKSFVQMKEMQRLKPEIDKLKEKFKSDKGRLNQETMALYKRYKINPLGGCLPMLLQMPIWIALYRTIYSSVELYQAPLFLWIDDLSAPDRFFVLPIIMGVSMFAQQWMTPQAGMDEAQAKIMRWMMPIMFTGFMLFLPSGLVLYIFVNTVLSLGQQLLIQRNSTPKEAVG
jgi:YidC/Oxa1 family membrane protein insertase